MLSFIDLRERLGKEVLDVADAAHVHSYVLPDLGYIDIDLDLLGFLSPLLGILSNPVAEPGTKSDDQVCLVDRLV